MKKSAAKAKKSVEEKAPLDLKTDKITRRYRALVEELILVRGGQQTSGVKKAVAELLGVHPTYISRVLGWQKRVGWQLAEQACKQLEISPMYFISEEGVEPDPAQHLQKRGSVGPGGVWLADVLLLAQARVTALAARSQHGPTEGLKARQRNAVQLLEAWDQLQLNKMRAAIGDHTKRDVTEEAEAFAVRIGEEFRSVAALEVDAFTPAIAACAIHLRDDGEPDLAKHLFAFVQWCRTQLERVNKD